MPDTTIMHVCLDSSAASHYEDPLWLTAEPTSDSVRIRAADLAESQEIRRRSRRACEAAGHEDTTISVILVLEVHIAAEARIARKELAASTVGRPESVRYVGTSSGLAGLIADIKAASVADGVVIVPVVDSYRAAVRRRVLEEVMPLLPAHVVGRRTERDGRRLTA
jgi:hypothetical protein